MRGKGREKGWLKNSVSGHICNLSSDHPTIDSSVLLVPSLSIIESKEAAFLLQNDCNEIASALQISSTDSSFLGSLKRYRAEVKKTIESRGGGFELYTKNKNVLQARKEISTFIRGFEECIEDSKTLLFNGQRVTTSLYLPLCLVNKRYKQTSEAFAGEKGRLASNSAEYVRLKNTANDNKRAVLETRSKKTIWMQSLQQGNAVLTRISLSELLRDGVSGKQSAALSAYANSVFYDEQMTDANLLELRDKSEFWPQFSHLEEFEGYLEREERLSFLANRQELEGVRRRDDKTGYKRRYRALHRYKVERAKKLFLLAKRLLNPDHEVAKIMLNQFKDDVEAYEKEKKQKNEKWRIGNSKRKASNINIELIELEDAAFGLLKQKILKSTL